MKDPNSPKRKVEANPVSFVSEAGGAIGESTGLVGRPLGAGGSVTTQTPPTAFAGLDYAGLGDEAEIALARKREEVLSDRAKRECLVALADKAGHEADRAKHEAERVEHQARHEPKRLEAELRERKGFFALTVGGTVGAMAFLVLGVIFDPWLLTGSAPMSALAGTSAHWSRRLLLSIKPEPNDERN